MNVLINDINEIIRYFKDGSISVQYAIEKLEEIENEFNGSYKFPQIKQIQDQIQLLINQLKKIIKARQG